MSSTRVSASMSSTRVSASMDGLDVGLFRGEDGKLVVEIMSCGLVDGDEHTNGCPNIRIWINEQKIEIAENGHLVVDGEEMPT
jgi:hypothetical protein